MQISCCFLLCLCRFIFHNNSNSYSSRDVLIPSPTTFLAFDYNLIRILFDSVRLVFVTDLRMSAKISFIFIRSIVKWVAFYVHSLYYHIIKSVDNWRHKKAILVLLPQNNSNNNNSYFVRCNYCMCKTFLSCRRLSTFCAKKRFSDWCTKLLQYCCDCFICWKLLSFLFIRSVNRLPV